MKKNKVNRWDFILQELLQNKRIRVEDLSRRFQVNASTIRRDLEVLEKKNLLRRVHGGAAPIDALSYAAYGMGLTFQKNLTKMVEEKSAIVSAAAEMIEPGENIALSPGTTTTFLARTIRHRQIPNLTVLTNAANIAMELAGVSHLTLIVTGGILLSDFFALTGPLAEQSLEQMYVSKAFLGVTGLSVNHGLTGPNQLEALSHRATMKRAREVIILADHSKIGEVALFSISPLKNIHVLVTDEKAPKDVLRSLEKMGIRVVIGRNP
ncbi:MAG: DeoR/GlpR transcriptional regulator [Candidatus Aminicenantes bacterium]|nr:DeoR/GlpR transcriptional regulator [Candidatus Aminicenantes bacterium]